MKGILLDLFSLLLCILCFFNTLTLADEQQHQHKEQNEQNEHSVPYDPVYQVKPQDIHNEPQIIPEEVKTVVSEIGSEWDPNGYLMYCPCMGRFGNQAEQFIGSLSFAKGMNRTLVLPPFISYGQYAKISLTPFDSLFDVDELRKYHRVITMERFFALHGSKWPVGKRIGQCLAYDKMKSCRHKEGNPFGPFWDHFDVTFDTYEPYSLPHNENQFAYQRWKEHFPAKKTPVLALPGPIGSFPCLRENRHLHKYLKWNNEMMTKFEDFINKKIQKPFVGIHLRNGQDWESACELTSKDLPSLMGSVQCLAPNEKVTLELCLPPKQMILDELLDVVKKTGAKSLFIATDSDSMEGEFKKMFQENGLKVKIVKAKGDDVFLDLGVLGQSDHFIGNCVSTFTSFVSREREAAKKPTTFWSRPNK